MKNNLRYMLLPLMLIMMLSPNIVFAGASANIGSLDFRTVIGGRLKSKIDEVFINTPKLLDTYNRMQDTELSMINSFPEYQDLLNSKELKILNNSPEMQEALKEVINEIEYLRANTNQEIDVINSQIKEFERELQRGNHASIGVSEIKKRIYAKESVVSGLETGIRDIIKSLNQNNKLYFTDPSVAQNIDDFTPIQKPDTLTTESILSGITNLNHIIDTRIIWPTATQSDCGFSAGDETTTDGLLWVKGFRSNAKQSQYGFVESYRSDQKGIVIGGTNLIYEGVGIAYAFIQDYVNNNTKKEKINSHIASIYWFYELNKNVFINAQAQYGRSYINKSRQNMNLSRDISYGKTDGDLYGGKLELYYNYMTQGKINMIPSVGIAYYESQIESYKEKGSGFNRSVETRGVYKTTGLLGLNINKAIGFTSYVITPAVHIKYMNILNARNDNTSITIVDGADPLITPSNKLHKTFYILGSSLKIRSVGGINIEIGYDFGKSKKYYSHTGYISATLPF